MTATQLMILKDARTIHARNGRRLGWSIADCITIAADGIWAAAAEDEAMRREDAQSERDLDALAAA